MKLKVLDFQTKEELKEIELADEVFNISINKKFISMHFQRMEKAHFIPTNKTKNISEVSGTTKKPYKQKGTGNARQGSLRSAQFVGGGNAFGPRGLKRKIKLPKKEVALVKSMLFSELIQKEKLFVVNDLNFNSNKTSKAVKLLNAFDKEGKKFVLLHDNNVNSNSLLAVRNLKDILYVNINMLTNFNLIKSDILIIEEKAIKDLEKILNI